MIFLMGDKLQILKTKYQMALVSIREAEQERDDLKLQLDVQKKKSQQIEKSTKYLCETILKKKKEDDKEVPWFKLELPAMIAEAQSSLEQYFPSIQDMLDKLVNNNSKYIERNFQLQQQLDQEKNRYKELVMQNNKNKARIEQLEEQVRTGSTEILQGNKTQQKSSEINTNGTEDEIEFIEEKHENMKKEIEQSLPVFHKSGEVEIRIPKGPNVKRSEATKKSTKESLDSEIKKRELYISQKAENLNEQQKFLIQIIGKTGYSKIPTMIEYCKKTYPDIPSSSRLNTGLNNITVEVPKESDSKLDPTADYIIEKRTTSNVGGAPKIAVYRLSFLGEDIYRYLFHKDPKVSEMTNLLRNHSSIDHGYGIAYTAAVLGNFRFIKESNGKVYFLTKRKDFIIQVNDKSSFIPDIVITYRGSNGKEYTEYFEYETGYCNNSDFVKKCNKIGTVCRMVNIIVPSKQVAEDTYNKAIEWKNYVKENGYLFKFERVTVRILSYDNLKKQTNIKSFMDLEWDQSIEVRKGGKR